MLARNHKKENQPYTLKLTLSPNRRSFTAVGAYIDIFPALENLPAEMNIFFMMPYFFERLAFQISKGMLRIFIKAAWNNESIPRYYGCMP